MFENKLTIEDMERAYPYSATPLDFYSVLIGNPKIKTWDPRRILALAEGMKWLQNPGEPESFKFAGMSFSYKPPVVAQFMDIRGMTTLFQKATVALVPDGHEYNDGTYTIPKTIPLKHALAYTVKLCDDIEASLAMFPDIFSGNGKPDSFTRKYGQINMLVTVADVAHEPLSKIFAYDLNFFLSIFSYKIALENKRVQDLKNAKSNA